MYFDFFNLLTAALFRSDCDPVNRSLLQFIFQYFSTEMINFNRI